MKKHTGVVLIGLGVGCGVISSATGQEVFNMSRRSWSIYYRTDRPYQVQAAAGGGIWFPFPESPLPDPYASPPWAGYLLTKLASSGVSKPEYHMKGRPITGSEITYTFDVEATPGVLWNYRSDTNNNGTRPASVRPYVQRHALYIWTRCYYRWWARENYVLADSGGPVSLTVPLNPDHWTDLYGHTPWFDQEHLDGFYGALGDVSYLGMTFGGGSFFGHGVNVSNGSATFTLKTVTTK